MGIPVLNHDQTNIQIIKRPIKILQFGGGKFIRGFADWMIDILNEQTNFNGNVLLIKPQSDGNYEALRRQDGLYHVILNENKDGDKHTHVRQIQCIEKIIHPYEEWTDFLNSATIPEIRFIISNTTEAGIFHKPNEILSWNNCPISFPGKLTLWLHKRFTYFNKDADKGCILLPLELVKQNGSLLKSGILKCAELMQFEKEFIHWIDNHNHFCNTLVDRIITGVPESERARIWSQIKYQDDQMVMGEYYHNWIIEGSEEIKKELPFSNTSLNVRFTDDLEIHRKIKVRILNGVHTAMVPLGLLSGHELVSQAIADLQIKAFLNEMIRDEILPTIDHPLADLEEFWESVLNRFSNLSIKHYLKNIGLHTTSKFTERLYYTLIDYYRINQQLPPKIVKILAAIIVMYRGTYDNLNLPLNDHPDTISFFNSAWHSSNGNLKILVQNILNNQQIWNEDFTKIPELEDMVVQELKIIESGGIKKLLN